MRVSIAARLLRVALVPRRLRRRGQPGKARIIPPRRAHRREQLGEEHVPVARRAETLTIVFAASERRARCAGSISRPNTENAERRRRIATRIWCTPSGSLPSRRRPRWRTSAAGSCAGWPEWPGRRSRPPRAPAARPCARRAARRRRRVAARRRNGSRAAAGRAHPAPARAHRAPRASLRAARARPRRSAVSRRSPRSRRNRARPRSGSTAGVIRRLEALHGAPHARGEHGSEVVRIDRAIQRRSAALGHQREVRLARRSGFCHSPR